MAIMTVRTFNLVVPLAQKATDMRITETAGSRQNASGAVTPLIGSHLRAGDVDRTNKRSTLATQIMPGIRISTTATRITTTRTTSSASALSADYQRHHPADFSFEELVQAYFDCRTNKRNTASALAFELNLESNLRALNDALKDGSYKPGISICFVITRPKAREVWAADFRDRIVHHLLYNHISPRFYATFIADSCACIPGRGTLYAGKRLESKIRSATENWSKPCFYLKCDLANFFVSIDKNILRELIARKVTEPWWLALSDLTLFHDPRTHYEYRGHTHMLEKVPHHKRLINQDANKGLPIGNLPSQFFANVYMNVLDQYIKHQIGAKYYIRYVDDIILLHESAQWLNDALGRINEFLLTQLNAKLNPSKTILQPVDRGVDFVGHVIKPWRRYTRKRTFNEAISRTKTIPSTDIFKTANSYFGLLRQASHSHHDRALLANVLRKRGHCINKSLTKTYRRNNHG